MRKICVVTTSRADYGILSNLIRKIDEDDELELQLLVSGTHLSKKFGYTVEEILADGIKPAAYVDIIAENDTTKSGVLNIMSNALNRIGKALLDLEPDLLIVLGDRYEMLAVVCSAVVLNVPIAHISGGDVTYGAYDDMFRHAITKMSNIHFASCEEYRRRIIQMGELPDSVFNVGALSLDSLEELSFSSADELNRLFQIDVKKTLLATFHPITMENNSLEQFSELLKALSEQKDYDVIITASNADTGSNDMQKMLRSYAECNKRIKIFASLGRRNYLSFMKHCAGVIGNSSSGIIEAPSFGIGTINIGTRQKGRIQAKSVINCAAKKENILYAIKQLSSKTFQESLKYVNNPYKGKMTVKNIVEKIKNFLKISFFPKKFFDIPFNA